MKFTTVTVTTHAEIEALANQSALTWTGMGSDNESLNAITQWLEDLNAFNDEPLVYHIYTGDLMNKSYGLRGNKAYPPKLSMLTVTGVNLMKVVAARFEVGGRWLDDIIANNAN